MSVSEIVLSQSTSDDLPSRVQVAAKPRTFACPACGGTVLVRTGGRALTAVCSSCSTIIDITNKNFEIIEKAQSAERPTLLPLGARGKLDGIVWEIVGYMLKTDATGTYPWDEYLLFNPYHGYRFLSHEAGHWTLSRVLKRDLTDPKVRPRVRLDGNDYKIFLQGAAIVRHVQGEFYWRARVGEYWQTTEYISPPYILSIEENDSEINFSLGRYVPRADVIKAFSPQAYLPMSSGVGANQPSPFEGRVLRLWLWTLGAIVAAFLIQFSLASGMHERRAYADTVLFNAVDKDRTYATQPFELQQSGAVEIKGYAPVDNDWVELSLTLVEENTNTEHTSVMPIEYYHGQDSDGYWSEGQQTETTYFSMIPQGSYRLLVDADSGAFTRFGSTTVKLEVIEGIAYPSNLLMALALLLIPPIVQSWRKGYFERQRWSKSDFKPDGSRGDSDDT
ncbi:DUF4178 domain-containing protein [Pleomorphomonas oryzae]|uniref:DUF4178 domain-containing protein n=1 Tax=Pleomorphomonas oryzae TaxID=261934 RepID=UPI000411556D|nr:DUF4178 domain-containing protein [Pleomorphomonas oryzae]